jgi:glycosyltransferase involved in cell wall biosynthesis
MKKLSAVIITFNAEKKITACLSSLQGVVDEIVVLDSFSTDQTPAICRQFGVRFHQQAWKGYGAQKNDAHALAAHDYILSLDADEYLSPELQQSLLAVKKSGLEGVYRFNRRNLFFGYTLRHGHTAPNIIIRCFPRKQVGWSLREVHETPIVPQGMPVHLLKGDLIHKSKDTLGEYISTLNSYSEAGARVMYQNGRRSGFFSILFRPAFTFIQGYFIRLGLLDGIPGLLMALTFSFETFLKYAKLYLLQSQKQGSR